MDLPRKPLVKSHGDNLPVRVSGETRTEWLDEALNAHVHSKEFFLRKAIGWALRDYGKTNPRWVRQWVDAHPELSGLSRREALRRLGSREEA